MAQPPAAAVDVECPSGQATGPDVLVDDEFLSVPSSDRDVALVDGCRKEVAITTSDRFQPVDRVIGETDDLVDDGLGHRREDRLDVAIVLSAQLPIDEPIKAGSHFCIEVWLRHHATHRGPGR